MSGGFKVPGSIHTPDPFQPGDEGGDFKAIQYATLAMYAVVTAVFPGVDMRSLVGYGLTVPADPQVMHRAADAAHPTDEGPSYFRRKSLMIAPKPI
ncbi:hypothetical protein [Nonomuraea sp. NPDC049400]|uniref:hypothetical protein n=1 Tax=Nonomuraea sp. NPDC049400 TaxID=3364352 RepID=UPI0037A2946C